ncbi:MAG: tyrosine-type recombinase/integrase [Terriglobales bacterium]
MPAVEVTAAKPRLSSARRSNSPSQTTIRRAKIPRLRFHDLRHTFATRLVGYGVDLLTVNELLGHSSIAMTMRYAHSSEVNMRNAVALLAGSDGHRMDTKRIEPHSRSAQVVR